MKRKSYAHSAATSSGKYHPFCRALSSVVSLYGAATMNPEVLQAVSMSLISSEQSLFVSGLSMSLVIHQISSFYLVKETGQVEVNVSFRLEKAHIEKTQSL